MTSDPGILELTDAALGRVYDPGSLRRGIAYAQEGRCLLVSSPPGTVRGTVQGSGRRAYLTKASWVADRRGLLISDECSCPLGGDCKHCVALLLTARDMATEHLGATRSGWRRTLADLVVDDGRSAATTTAAPLALEFTINPSPSGHGHRGGARPRLNLRPMREGKNGKWVKTGASWRDISLPYPPWGQALHPAQTSVLRAMLSAVPGIGYYPPTKAIEFSQFGPDIWFHLRRAVEEGIALVRPGRARASVVLSNSPARVSVDLTADATGAVTIGAGFDLSGDALPFDPECDGLLGDPVKGLFVHAPDTLRLIPLAEPLHPALRELLTAPTVVVPPAEVDEMLDGYQPALSRVAEVASSDGSVEITTAEFDCLTLTIERTTLDTAELRWGVRYCRGTRTIHHPLAPTSSPGRDQPAEFRAVDALDLPTHLPFGLADPLGRPHDLTVTGTDTITLLSEVVPWLHAHGQVAVEVVGDQPEFREAVEDPLISLTVTDGRDADRPGDLDRTDWFDLSVSVSVDGEPVEFARILAAMTRGDELLILPSGSWLRLDRPELARLRELIEEARGLADRDGDGAVRINRFQTSWWDDLAGLGIIEEQSARWMDGIDRMRGLSVPEPVEPPPGLLATLRPYQQEGLDWLAFLYRSRLGGILADDMGLGKTVQTLGLCLHVLDQQPDARFLVVAPTSVVENWHREASTFAPGVAVRTIHETQSRRGTGLAEAIGDARIVVTSYALFRLEFDSYQDLDWELLLLDEAQFVKNHRGKTYQCVRRLDAVVKVALTGTPLENSLMDLWSLLSITAPGLYPDPSRFSEVYRKPIESGRSPELLATLQRRIAPLMRRRTKDAVLDDLPPKTEQTVEVEMSARHARIYQTQLQRQRQKVLGLVGDVTKNRFEILKSLTMLRQLCLDPGLVSEEHDSVGSAKLDRLVEDLTQVVDEGHRALVFSQFTRYLARVRNRLDDAGIGHAYLDGRTRRREEAIDSFKDGDLPVFVISLKAGGFGLNLTEADYCFVLDPWWNPAVETQAVDRTHRIGQRNAVMVYRYVSVGTIEEKVMDLKARKADLFANVMDSEGTLSSALTEGDIRGLLDLAE